MYQTTLVSDKIYRLIGVVNHILRHYINFIRSTIDRTQWFISIILQYGIYFWWGTPNYSNVHLYISIMYIKLLIQLFIKGWEMNIYNEFSIFTILCQNGYETGRKIYSKVTRSLSTLIIIIVNKVNLMAQDHIM